MLEVGKKRAQNMGYNPNQIAWKVGDAQNLDFPDDTFDAYTIAYGIRNVVDINQALREAYRFPNPQCGNCRNSLSPKKYFVKSSL